MNLRSSFFSFASIFCFFFLPILSASSYANDKPLIPVSTLRLNDINYNPEIKKTLLLLNGDINRNNTRNITTRIEKLKTLRLNLHTQDIPFVAEYLRKKGEVVVEGGDPDTGKFVLEKAKEAFPFAYKIYFSLSNVYLSQSPSSFKKAYLNLKDGLTIYLDMKSRRSRFYRFSFLTLLCLSVVSVYIYLIFLFAKNFKLIFPDIKRRLSISPENKGMTILVILAIFLPLIVGGSFLFFLSVILMVAPYLNKNRDKALIAASSLILLSVLPLTTFVTPGSLASISLFEKKVENFSREIWDVETSSVFREAIKKRGGDYFLYMALGLMRRWEGDTQKALKYFRILENEFPENPDLLVNMGNIYLTEGKNREAAEIYSKAIQIDPNHAEAHYNLKFVFENLLEFDKAEEEYNKALALNPERIHNILSIPGQDKIRLMDILPKHNFIKSKIDKNSSSSDLRNIIKRLMLLPSGLGWILFSYLFFFAGFSWVLKYLSVISISKQCDLCGSVIDKEANCLLCTALKLSPERLDAKRRDEGLQKIKRFRKRADLIPMVFNLLFPGTGEVLNERNIVGLMTIFITVFLFFCMTINMFCLSGFIPTAIFLIFFAVWYVLSNLIFFVLRQ